MENRVSSSPRSSRTAPIGLLQRGHEGQATRRVRQVQGFTHRQDLGFRSQQWQKRVAARQDSHGRHGPAGARSPMQLGCVSVGRPREPPLLASLGSFVFSLLPHQPPTDLEKLSVAST